MSTVRVVRPRPLDINDRIPVFWAGQEPSQELKQIDGGALYRHLVASSTPAKNRKRKRPERYHAPKEGEAHEHFSPLRKGQEQQANGPIAIPQVRIVEDYALNQQAAAHHGPMVRGDIHAAPYLRHKELLPGMYEEHQFTEYDADDKDVAWLNNINSKNGSQGLFAAAVGLYHHVAQRISRTNSDAAATPPAPDVRLSVDVLEKAIDMLELMHFDAVKAWWDEQQSAPSTSAPQVPEIPAMKRLLPRATALEQLSRLIPDSKLASQVLEYWARKRQQEGGPLLARIWFEQPWKLVAFAEFVVSDDEDFDEHLPFMAVEPRSAHKNRRTGNQRRRTISDEDALDALHGLRNELEVLRTLADQVRKREKLKRQLLVVSQQETQMRMQFGISPAAPMPRAAKQQQQRAAPQARGGGTAAPAGTAAAAATPGTAAGTSAAAAGRKGRTAANQPAAHAPVADVSRRLAQAAAVAAAAASPAEGSHGRQTRTAAAAAAAEFEITFAAKKEILAVAGAPAEAAAAPTRLHRLHAAAQQPEASNAAADEDGPSSRRRKRDKAADGSVRGDVCGGGRTGVGSTGKKQRHNQAAAAAAAAAAEGAEADDEGSEQPEGSPASSLQVLEPEAVDQELEQPLKQRRRLLSSQQRAAGVMEGTQQQQQQQHQQHRPSRVRPRSAAASGQHEMAEHNELQPQHRPQGKHKRRRAAAVAAAAVEQQAHQQRQQHRMNKNAAAKSAPAASLKLRKQHKGQQQPSLAAAGQQQQQHSPSTGRQKAAATAASMHQQKRDASDDSDDADYVASEEEELTDEWQLQQLRRGVHAQAVSQRLRSSGQAVEGASESSSSGSEEEDVADGWEPDDDFKSRSARTLRRVQLLQLQQRKARPKRQQAAIAGAQDVIATLRQSPKEQKQLPKPVHLHNSRANGCTKRRHTAAVPAVDLAAEDSGSDRSVPAAAAAVAGGLRSKQQRGEQLHGGYTVRKAVAVAHSPAEHAVLRPHNQQHRTGKLTDVQHKGSSRPGSARAKSCTAAAGQAIAAHSAGAGANASAIHAALQCKGARKRGGSSERELRKLGFDAPGPAWQLPATASMPTRRKR